MAALGRAAEAVDALLAQVPADDPERPALQARAGKYSRECGCALAGAFLAAALLLALIHFATGGHLGLRTGVEGALFVLGAAALGKAVGLLQAQLKLAWLRRLLSRKLERTGVSHVYVH